MSWWRTCFELRWTRMESGSGKDGTAGSLEDEESWT